MKSVFKSLIIVPAVSVLFGCNFQNGMNSKTYNGDSSSSLLGKPELAIHGLSPDSANPFQATLSGSCDKKGSDVLISGDVLNGGSFPCNSRGAFSAVLNFSEQETNFQITATQTAVNNKTLNDRYLYVINTPEPPADDPPADDPPADDPPADDPPADDPTADDPPADDPPADDPPADDPPADDPPNEDVVGACLEYPTPTYDPADFDHIIENIDHTTTLRLDGSQWDNTLVRNCRIHDVTAEGGGGIRITNVKNVVVDNCEIDNVPGSGIFIRYAQNIVVINSKVTNTGKGGIKTSSDGSSDNVQIIGNTIRGTGYNGMHFPQRIVEGVDATNVIVANNSISETGKSGDHGGYHGIYSQSQGTILSGNYVFGERDGNGLSFRSSGQISCNKVEGFSRDGKPGIRYFSDHTTGDPSVLVIEKNQIYGQSAGVNIYRPTTRYGDGATGYDFVVKSFIIRDNDVSQNDKDIEVDDAYYNNSIFSVTVEGNY